MPSWLIICIVCVIYGFLMTPVEKWIKKRIANKYLSYLVTFLTACVLLFVMYGICGLLGFDIFNKETSSER